MSLAAAARPAPVPPSPAVSPSSRGSLRLVRVRPGDDLRASIADGAGVSAMVGVGETYFAAFALALGTGETVAGLVATLPMLAGGNATARHAVVLGADRFVQAVGRAVCQLAGDSIAGDAHCGLLEWAGGGGLGLCGGGVLLGGKSGDRAGVEYVDRRNCAAAAKGQFLCREVARVSVGNAGWIRGGSDGAGIWQRERLAARVIRGHFCTRVGVPVYVGVVFEPA